MPDKHIHLKDLSSPQDESGQLAIRFKRTPYKVDYSLDTVWRLPSLMRAFEFAITLSGLEDADIFPFLKTIDGTPINQGMWSRIKNGSLNFDLRQISEFNKLVGNRVLLQWVCFQDGCMPTQIQSETEKALVEAEANNLKLAHENQVLRSVIGVRQP